MEKDLPKEKNPVNTLLIGILCFIFGLAAGAGGFYFYSQKVLIPKRETQLMSEIFQGESTQWADFFEAAASGEGEYTNPFGTGSEETSGTEEYVNPFENLQ